MINWLEVEALSLKQAREKHEENPRITYASSMTGLEFRARWSLGTDEK
jgi:hypothetical protein